MPKRIKFTVYGKPQSRGSKQASVRYGRDGKPISKDGRVLTFAKDSNPKSTAWMEMVTSAAAKAYSGNLLTGAVRLSVQFFFARPKAHYGSGRNASLMKESAPAMHIQTPDFSKCMRAVEDALTGVVWRDDCQIVGYGVANGKYWTNGQARAEIEIFET